MSGVRRASGLCCGRPITRTTGLLYRGDKFSGILFYGSKTRTGRYTVGLTEGCDFSHCNRGQGAVVSLIGSFRNEAVTAVATAKRRRCRGCFVPFVNNFGCTRTNSGGTFSRLLSKAIYTMVLRIVRNRNKIMVAPHSCVRCVERLYSRGSVILVFSRIRANINEANGLCT